MLNETTLDQKTQDIIAAWTERLYDNEDKLDLLSKDLPIILINLYMTYPEAQESDVYELRHIGTVWQHYAKLRLIAAERFGKYMALITNDIDLCPGFRGLVRVICQLYAINTKGLCAINAEYKIRKNHEDLMRAGMCDLFTKLSILPNEYVTEVLLWLSDMSSVVDLLNNHAQLLERSDSWKKPVFQSEGGINE